MDPLTALSVAGTIVQFADFGIRLFSDGRELYKSQDGALAANSDIEEATKSLHEDVQKLKDAIWVTNPEFPLTEADEAHRRTLEALCAEATKIARDLIYRFERLKVKGFEGRRWQSFRQVIKSAWSKDEIAALVKRLVGFKEALATKVLFSVRADVNAQSIRASEHFQSLDKYTKTIISKLISTGQATSTVQYSINSVQDKTKALMDLVRNLDATNRKEHLDTRRMIKEHDNCYSRAGGIDEIMAKILNESPIQEAMVRKSAHNAVLRTLAYPSMSSRFEDVHEAYPKTFDWAFCESNTELPWDNLSGWLRAGNGIYWIGGKAGSGKSTLMKYISTDIRPRQYLSIWAGTNIHDTKFCIATFYFWNSGTPEQQSQTGLLRALLFQIFSSYPELVQLLLPDLWAKSYDDWMQRRMEDLIELWPLKKLLRVFRAVLQQDDIPLKLFFLVDGLDEFDGNPEIIIELLLEIAQTTRVNEVKACLSSRPWIVFEDYFKDFPKLRLQDLTRDDIDHYVHDSFRSNRAFQALESREPELAPQLLRDVVEKADGVFLWIRIVVKSLLEGVRNRDDMAILHERLDMLPPELEPLYETLLGRIEPLYARWASKVFQVMRVSRELAKNPFRPQSRDGTFEVCLRPLNLPMLFFSISDNIESTNLDGSVTVSYSMSCYNTRVQLTVRCAGLMEVSNADPDALVQYLHRSVRDFLEKPRHWSKLLARTAKTDFSPHWGLLRALNLQERLQYLKEGRPSIDKAQYFLSQAFILAYYANSHTSSYTAQTKTLDSLIELAPRWVRTALGCENIFSEELSLQQMGVLEVAMYYGLSGYLDQKLVETDKGTVCRKASVLLASLLRCQGFIPAAWAFPPMRPEVVSTLLQHGADPNMLFGTANEVHATPWNSALYSIWRAGTQFSHIVKPEYVQVMKLLSRSGVNPHERVRIPCEERSYSAVEIITNFLSPRFPLEAAEILQELDKKFSTKKPRALMDEDEDESFLSPQKKRRRIS